MNITIKNWRSHFILTLVPAFLLNIYSFTRAMDLDLPTVEKLFHDHFLKKGVLIWPNFKEPFCKFMRPTGYTLLITEFNDEESTAIELVTYGSTQIPAQILRCFYGKTKSRTVTLSDWLNDLDFIPVFYAHGPDGKYYEMRPSENNFEDFVIYDEVKIPPENIEKIFHDHYTRHGALRWTLNQTQAFCESTSPINAISFLSAHISTKNVTLVSVEYETIQAELLDCGYLTKGPMDFGNGKIGINGSETETHSYASAPNGKYYEMRLYNIRPIDEMGSYAIFQEVTITLPEL